MTGSLSDGPQWSQPPGVHNALKSRRPLSVHCPVSPLFVFPREYSTGDGMSFPTSGYKTL